jgi:hypothetical protein
VSQNLGHPSVIKLIIIVVVTVIIIAGMNPEPTQPPTEMSTRDISWGVKAAGV